MIPNTICYVVKCLNNSDSFFKKLTIINSKYMHAHTQFTKDKYIKIKYTVMLTILTASKILKCKYSYN